MGKGVSKPLIGFGTLDRMTAVAGLAKKIARVVADVPPDMANEALRAAFRNEIIPPGTMTEYPAPKDTTAAD